MLGIVSRQAPRHKFRFKNDLYSIDATTVDLCLGLYDWAKFRTTKGGIKVHVKLNHSGYIPEFVAVTEAKRQEVKELPKLQLKSGDVVAFDRGYADFKQFAKYCDEGIYFVTRLKKNANYKVVARNDVSTYKNISSDHIIEMTGFYTKQKCPMQLRRIRVKDPETRKYIVLLTNQMNWAPTTVASVYKDRWQIEIFFKMMKQNLKITSFLGTSRNAMLSQIWVAMIAYLLLSYMKFLSTYNWTVNSLMNVLPTVLFSRRDLIEWLHHPFGPPPPGPSSNLQLVLL
jgi:co-chaperonin GroES (HSP10)